jgi:hypothetical protein
MNNVPLINNLTVNDINTALIAIKKNLVKGANGNEQLQDVDVNVDVNIAQNCTYCAADSTTIKGAELFQGCSIKVLFTSAITGSNTTSPLTINYNNVDITVKVGKNGALVDFVAYNTGSGFIYCQAYTTLELLFDGNNFVIMGNPVVISNSDYTVYTDGSIVYSANYINANKLNSKKIQLQIGASYNFTVDGYYLSFQCYGIAIGQDRMGGIVIGEGGNYTWYNTINSALLPTVSGVYSSGKTTITLTNNTSHEQSLDINYIA